MLIQDFAKGEGGRGQRSCQRSIAESCEKSKPFVAGVQGPLIYLHETVMPLIV